MIRIIIISFIIEYSIIIYGWACRSRSRSRCGCYYVNPFRPTTSFSLTSKLLIIILVTTGTDTGTGTTRTVRFRSVKWSRLHSFAHSIPTTVHVVVVRSWRMDPTVMLFGCCCCCCCCCWLWNSYCSWMKAANPRINRQLSHPYCIWSATVSVQVCRWWWSWSVPIK